VVSITNVEKYKKTKTKRKAIPKAKQVISHYKALYNSGLPGKLR